MGYIIGRLREGPTWAGVFIFLDGVAKVNFSADTQVLIMQAGQALAGLLLIALPNVFKAKEPKA